MLRYIPVVDAFAERVRRQPERPPYASLLRREITARASAWAQKQGVPWQCSTGQSAAVLFCEEEDGRHGNFFPAAYQRILATPSWRRRLRKTHTSARRYLATHDPDRRELDAATSSDALLMSIFCHPSAFTGSSSLRHLLGTEAPERLEFGYMPRIPLITRHVERTEVDLRIGHLLIEAKLTENDFQTVRRPRMKRYLDVHDIFALEDLPCSGDLLLHYQLLRGALAAHAQPERRYCLLCDARRPDLIDAWYAVMRAVREVELRSRLTVVTWQEIARALPSPLQVWLSEKYGIEP
ncbi:MAG: hypothetical protein JWM54_1542 [Acidobacteriaceae bacterium]|nr:hypothetical protein [Acidobacteriaceae bacterium]